MERMGKEGQLCREREMQLQRNRRTGTAWFTHGWRSLVPEAWGWRDSEGISDAKLQVPGKG